MTKTATPQKQILVITGSYERLLYGLALDMPSGKMTPQWVFPAHISCIKTLSVSSRFLASGSSGSLIKSVMAFLLFLFLNPYTFGCNFFIHLCEKFLYTKKLFSENI